MWLIGFLLEFAVTVLGAVLWIYFWALIIRAILSWFPIEPYHPFIRILHQITDPVIYPLRRLIPPLGGLDLSVLILLIFIQLVIARILPRLHLIAAQLQQ